jgi:DHA2 family multidrug resistance protein-like MFS transporter
MLIATRALLGIAGATVAPSTLSLIRNMFLDTRQRTVAIGVWISSYSIGAAVGPLLGGLLLEFFWWGSVFLVGVPVTVLLLAVGPLLLPEYRDPQARRLDLISAALSLAAVLAVIYGLKQIAEHGVESAAILSITIGVFAGGAFVFRQTRLSDPLIDLHLFRAPAFSASLAMYTLSIFAAFGVFLFIAQYLQLVLGLSPLEAGLWTMPWPLAFVVGSMLTPTLIQRIRPGFLMAGGMALAAVGFLVLTLVTATSGLAVLFIGSVLMSLGLAPVFTLATDMILGTAPPERAGAASAISETGAEFGGAVGIAILGSIGTAVYQSEIAGGIPPGISSEDAEVAKDTLGGAVDIASGLSDPLGPALLEAARGAFLSGFEVSLIFSAIVSAALCVLAVVTLREARPGSEVGAEGDFEGNRTAVGGAGIE